MVEVTLTLRDGYADVSLTAEVNTLEDEARLTRMLTRISRMARSEYEEKND